MSFVVIGHPRNTIETINSGGSFRHAWQLRDDTPYSDRGDLLTEAELNQELASVRQAPNEAGIYLHSAGDHDYSAVVTGTALQNMQAEYPKQLYYLA